MSFITSLFSGGVDKIVDSVANGIDSLVTSDEERLVAENVLAKIKLEAQIQSETISMDFEKEVTKRWTSDNQSLVTKLVRPVSIIYMLALFGVIVLMDGNIGEFAINKAYIPVIENLLITMVIGYFGARSLDKFTTMKGK